MGSMDKAGEYTSRCHLVTVKGHVWPDTKENRKLGRKTKVELTPKEAARHGADLTRVGDAAEKMATAPQNKQVTGTENK